MDEGPDVTADKAADCFKASSGFDGGGNEDIADTSFSFICRRPNSNAVKIDTIGDVMPCGVHVSQWHCKTIIKFLKLCSFNVPCIRWPAGEWNGPIRIQLAGNLYRPG